MGGIVEPDDIAATAVTSATAAVAAIAAGP